MLPSFNTNLWSVSALLRAVSSNFETTFSICRVIGEISALNNVSSSGHVYFSLKDENQSNVLIRCALFKRHAAMAGFELRNGQRVEIRGRLSIYEARGDFQLVVESIQLAGQGTLYEEFLQIKNRLQKEGLFDDRHKRALPAYPFCIGVVTSLSGSVLHDIAITIARKAPHIQLIIYPSLVQGREAAQHMIKALQDAAQHKHIELLILARGGGSIEDLWAFNDESLVRAIAQFPMPIVTGIGHETDITLSDYAADFRAPTPTAAAELCAPDQQRLLAKLNQFEIQELLDIELKI